MVYSSQMSIYAWTAPAVGSMIHLSFTRHGSLISLKEQVSCMRLFFHSIWSNGLDPWTLKVPGEPPFICCQV